MVLIESQQAPCPKPCRGTLPFPRDQINEQDGEHSRKQTRKTKPDRSLAKQDRARFYEVSWQGTRTISAGNAPITETQVLTPAADNKGVVKGLVTKGKMYLAEYPGQEQVQYTQREEPSGTNYIYYGQ